MSKELKQTIKLLENHLDDLRNEYGVKQIGVFGSVASGLQKKSSDVDILVEFKQPIGFFRFVELERHLTKMLGRRVDLVTKPALKPILKKNILRQVVYASP